MTPQALIVTPPAHRFVRPDSIAPSIFLGGSIEMGVARDWQAEAIETLSDAASVIYNPRRVDWDSSWEQSIEHAEFNGQVNWEMSAIERADLVVMHFEPETKSPITMGELYWCLATKPNQTFVSCPQGFWRRGNIEIMCERYGAYFYGSLEGALKKTRAQALRIMSQRLNGRS